MEKAVNLSRVYTQEALQHIQNISNSFNSCSKQSGIDEEESKFILNNIKNAGRALSKVQFSNYSFQEDFYRYTQKTEDCIKHNDFSEAKDIFKYFSENISNIEKELKKSVMNTDSESEELKDFESFGNNVFGSQESRKQFIDSIKSAYNDFVLPKVNLDFFIKANKVV